MIKTSITSPKDVLNNKELLHEITKYKYEVFTLIVLDGSKEIVTKYTQKGTISGVKIDIRKLFLFLLRNRVDTVIIAHNHITNPNASREDVRVYEKLKELLNEFDIKLLDSLVCTKHTVCSILENEIYRSENV